MNIAIKVTPGARRDELVGWKDDYPGIGHVLRLRISAPAIENRANKAIESFLAQLLHLPKSAVHIIRGSSNSIKLVQLPDGTDISALHPEVQPPDNNRLP